MIDWTDKAVEAALSAYWDRDWTGACKDKNYKHRTDGMRAALDAAVKAQGATYRSNVADSFEEGRRMGRAEALEEAAAIATEMKRSPEGWLRQRTAYEIAIAIRALKGETP